MMKKSRYGFIIVKILTYLAEYLAICPEHFTHNILDRLKAYSLGDTIF